MENTIRTTHNLDFEVTDWECMGEVDQDFLRFRVGTCEGLYKSSPTSFDILAITNSVPGNGHFEDVLEWFYSSCRRDQKDLVVLEVWNKGLKQHLIHKRKFKAYRMDDVILKFKNIPNPPQQ